MRLFLDTSVLFSGILSATGGARLILKMGRVDQLELIISTRVLNEIIEVLHRKLPEAIDEVRLLLDTANIQVVSDAPPNMVELINQHVNYLADAQVIAAAQVNQVDYFVTLDKRHFLKNQQLQSAVIFPIGTPGDFLAWYRQKQVIDD